MRNVIRKQLLAKKLGCGLSTLDEIVKSGAIRIFPLTPGGRIKVAFEDEVNAYLEQHAEEAIRSK